MESTAGFGRLVGWVSICAGAALILFGIFAAGAEAERAAYSACEMDRRIGLRATPCPPPGASMDRPILIGAGVGAATSGVLFLLLSGILTTMLAIQAGHEADRRERRTPVAAPPRTASAPTPEKVPQPREAGGTAGLTNAAKQRLVIEYGEVLATRMFTEMQVAAARGVQLSDTEAKRRAETWLAANPNR